MTRRRRPLLLGVLAVVLGGLAASDVSGREAALRHALGPGVLVLVAQQDLRAGTPLTRDRLALRRVPARYAPRAGFTAAADVSGLRAAVAIPAGTDLVPALAAAPATRTAAAGAGGVPVGPGQRVAQLVAQGSPQLIAAGSRVDVLVTRETGAQRGSTTLALQDAEVLSVSPAPSGTGADDDGPRVSVALRVSLRDAVYLAAAQSFAKELRLLPRAAGDHARTPGDLVVGSGLP